MYKYYTTGQLAKERKVSSQTIRRWVKQGKFDEVIYTEGGDCRIGIELPVTTILYARVSSKKQESSIKNQLKLLEKHYKDTPYETMSDIGSGFNFKRKGFRSILERCLRGECIEVVVSNQDRFTRVGFEFLQWIFQRTGGSIEVLDQTETKPEFDYDNLISFITVFCNSYYGKRAASRNKENKNLSEG